MLKKLEEKMEKKMGPVVAKMDEVLKATLRTNELLAEIILELRKIR